MIGTVRRPMSALPPKADKRADVSLNALCARKRRVHRALKCARCATALDMDVWRICWQDGWLERKDTRQCLATSGFLCSEHCCSRPQLERNRCRLTKRA